MSATKGSDEPPLGYAQLIRENRNFRSLWFGQIISLLGDWFTLIASASLVALLTRSGFAIGGLFVVRMLAPFLLSPIAGVVADRYNRKHILMVTDLIRARARLCHRVCSLLTDERGWLRQRRCGDRPAGDLRLDLVDGCLILDSGRPVDILDG